MPVRVAIYSQTIFPIILPVRSEPLEPLGCSPLALLEPKLGVPNEKPRSCDNRLHGDNSIAFAGKVDTY
jgi:hypothetical protein